MSTPSQDALERLTLRHWTTDSRRLVGPSVRPAPAPPYSEEIEGGQFHRLARKLAQVKSDLTRPAR